MKKNLKKLLAMGFALAMAFSLVACGGGEDKPEEKAEESTASETEEKAEAEEETDAEEAEEGEEAEESEEGEEDADSEEGFDISQVEGITWGIDTMNGMVYEEACEKFGLDPDTSNAFWTIEGDTITSEANGTTTTGSIEVTDTGFIIDGQLEVTYHPDNNTLTYTMTKEQSGGNQDVDAVLVPYE